MLKALDLFCGAGGAALGLIRAGYQVTGIDINPTLKDIYPGKFIAHDLSNGTIPVNIQDYDLIWASPPCQKFSVANRRKIKSKIDLIPQTLNLLLDHPYQVIENVPQAPIRKDLILTGPTVGLIYIERRRHFQLSWKIPQPKLIHVPKEYWAAGLAITVTKSMASDSHFYPRKRRGLTGIPKLTEVYRVMDIDLPMSAAEIGEAIPPAYSFYIASRAPNNPMNDSDRAQIDESHWQYPDIWEVNL